MNINFTLVMQAAAFFAFIWFCARFIWPPLMRAIETRQKQIAEGLAASEAGRQSLTTAEKQISVMLAEAKARSSEILAQGEKLRSETIEAAKGEAQVEAERIVTQAKAEIEQAIAQAREALRNQVADLAVAGATQILKREVNPQVHAQLLSELQRQL